RITYVSHTTGKSAAPPLEGLAALRYHTHWTRRVKFKRRSARLYLITKRTKVYCCLFSTNAASSQQIHRLVTT
ncbi:hypothetical protein M9458_052624, partial [Cirrhinus mrigala]